MGLVFATYDLGDVPLRGKKGVGVLPGGRAHSGAFTLRVLKAESVGEVFGEGLNRTFISFVLMHQNKIYSLTSSCPGV